MAALVAAAVLLIRRFEADPAPAPLPNVEWNGWYEPPAVRPEPWTWN